MALLKTAMTCKSDSLKGKAVQGQNKKTQKSK